MVLNPTLILTLAQAKDALHRKDITATELTTAYLDRIDALNKDVNAYITPTVDRALSDAKKSDDLLQKGAGGLLEGIPLAIKDLFCTQGIQTTAASYILKGFIPPYESTVTKNLWDAGAVCLGKTNMDEFAMGSANTNSYFGPVQNPYRAKNAPDKPLVPGGSSGGSAAAVAFHMALGATGSDTGGSIRQPASFCGLVGIKPTYGRCSRYGMIAFASSLDQAGPITRTVSDAALMLQAMQGFDAKDATSVKRPPEPFYDALTSDVKGMRIGICRAYMDKISPVMTDLMNKAMSWLSDKGCTFHDVVLEQADHALATYYVIAPAEASANLARFDGIRYGLRLDGATLDEVYENTRTEGFGAEVKRRILIGCYVLSSGYYDAYYRKAQNVRRLIKNEFHTAFQTVDMILTPTTPTAAFPIGEHQKDPVQMYLNDIFTVTANIAGLPAISVPCGLDEQGLPLGIQLIGAPFAEQTILNGALALEQQAGFNPLFFTV